MLMISMLLVFIAQVMPMVSVQMLFLMMRAVLMVLAVFMAMFFLFGKGIKKTQK